MGISQLFVAALALACLAAPGARAAQAGGFQVASRAQTEVYSCVNCNLGDVCDNPVLEELCECSYFTDAQGDLAFESLSAATLIVAGYYDCGNTLNFDGAQSLVWTALAYTVGECDTSAEAFRALCSDEAWYEFIDNLFELLEETCDNCDIDCNAIQYIVSYIWPALYAPCCDVSGGGPPPPPPPPPPIDYCPNHVPQLLWDACGAWADGCIEYGDLATLFRSFWAELEWETYGTCTDADFPYLALTGALVDSGITENYYEQYTYDGSYMSDICADLIYNDAELWGIFLEDLRQYIAAGCGGYDDCDDLDAFLSDDGFNWWYGVPCYTC